MCFVCTMQSMPGSAGFFDPHFSGPSAAEINEGSDAVDNTSSTASMAPDDTFNGSLVTTTDGDWIAITLEAGKTYTFSLTSDDLNDPEMNLYDANGELVSGFDDGVNDFSAGGFYSVLSTGTYFIDVDDFDTGDIGSYAVTVTENLPVKSPDRDEIQDMADYLRTGNWNGSQYTWDSNVVTVNINGLTADTQQLAIWAMEAWEAVVNIDFQLVNFGEDITVDDEYSGAYAYTPGATDAPYVTGGVEMNVNKNWGSDAIFESYWFQTYIHEFGHALGLGHQGSYDGNATYSDDAIFTFDSWQYSVMSYFSQDDNPNDTQPYAFTITPMLADILAIQDLYGTPDAVNSPTAGNTTYGENSSLGNYLDFFFGWLTEDTNSEQFNVGQMVLTLYDVSGDDDLLSFDFVEDDANLNLIGGSFSSFGSLTDMIAIAYDTVIENVILGIGDDTITLNDAENSIVSGAGDDMIIGAGAGDEIDGGLNYDTLQLDFAQADVTGGSNIGGVMTIQTDAGSFTVQNVESFQLTDAVLTFSEMAALVQNGNTAVTITGTTGDDVMLDGNSVDNLISGRAGNDTISGLEGNDLIYAGGGFDKVYGGIGRDVIYGNGSNDLLNGAGDIDSLFGGTGNDTLTGGEGDDVLNGDEGHDKLYGGLGRDLLDGSVGRDLLYGGDNVDTLYGGLEFDRLYGDDGDDDLYGGGFRDNVFGGAGLDALYGDDGNDRIYGGNDADYLYGGAGSDTLDGGAGSDTIDGGTFADVLYGGVDGSDLMQGGTGDDTLYGGNGNDVMNGDAAVDILYGGAGNDTMDGGTFGDSLYGGTGEDILVGGDGADSLYGGADSDVIDGGAGNDVLSGAGGADTFVFDIGDGGATIIDFNASQDILLISESLLSTSVAEFDVSDYATQETAGLTLTFAGVVSVVFGTTLTETQIEDNFSFFL